MFIVRMSSCGTTAEDVVMWSLTACSKPDSDDRMKTIMVFDLMTTMTVMTMAEATFGDTEKKTCPGVFRFHDAGTNSVRICCGDKITLPLPAWDAIFMEPSPVIRGMPIK
eukprot:6564585-Karenia_brevis.AAC.1